MGNNAPDYKNLFFEKSIELNHSEKMRDYTAEYVVKLEEKLEIAKEALSYYAKQENKCFNSTEWHDWSEEYATVVGDIENGYKARQALTKIGG